MLLISSEMLELLERFQTTLVGVVGFFGVIWTLRANAEYARAEHQRQIDTKRANLRRILAAEFRSYSHALKGNLEKGAPDDELFSIGKIRRILSENLAGDLGLLELGEVDVVVNAVISFDGLEHYLENLSSHQTENRFLIPTRAWDEYCTVASTTADALDLAIEVLEMSDEA